MTVKKYRYNYDNNCIEEDGRFFAYLNTSNVHCIVNRLNEQCDLADTLKKVNSIQDDEINKLRDENKELKQQLSDIDGQLLMFDNCDNWDYDRVMYTVRQIAKIMDYHGGI